MVSEKPPSFVPSAVAQNPDLPRVFRRGPRLIQGHDACTSRRRAIHWLIPMDIYMIRLWRQYLTPVDFRLNSRVIQPYTSARSLISRRMEYQCSRLHLYIQATISPTISYPLNTVDSSSSFFCLRPKEILLCKPSRLLYGDPNASLH